MPEAGHNPANLAVFVSHDQIKDLDCGYTTVGAQAGFVDTDIKSLKEDLAIRFGKYHLDIGKSLGINKVRVKITMEVRDVSLNTVYDTYTYDRIFNADEFLFLQFGNEMTIVSRGLEESGEEKSPANFTYTDSAERLAATFTNEDIWKIAYQSNTETFWELTNVNPPKWRKIYDPRIHEAMYSSMWRPLAPMLFLDVTRDESGNYTGGTVENGNLKLSPAVYGDEALQDEVESRFFFHAVRLKGSAHLFVASSTTPIDWTHVSSYLHYPIGSFVGFSAPSSPDPHYRLGELGPFNTPIPFNPFAWDVQADFYSEGFNRFGSHAFPPGSLAANEKEYWKIGCYTKRPAGPAGGFIDYRLCGVGDDFVWCQVTQAGIPTGGTVYKAWVDHEVSFTLRDGFEES